MDHETKECEVANLYGQVANFNMLMDRNNMSNLYREPSMDASYQVAVHLAKRFQRRRFLEIDQLETRIACGSHIC